MIRWATPADALQVARIYAPSVLATSISFELVAPSAAEMETRIAAGLAFAPWLVCEREGEVLGFAYASKHRERAAYRWAVDVSVYVDGRQRRRGIARGLYASLFALLRLQGFYAAHAGIALPNPQSVGLHEALGFRQIGVYPGVGYKLGAWHDVGWWQLSLRERANDPSPPLAPDAVRDEPGGSVALAAGLSLLRF